MPTLSLTNPTALTVITAGLHATNYSAIQSLINGGLANDNLSPSAAIVQSKVSFDAWQAFTPVVNAYTPGPGASTQGRWVQIGKTVIGSLNVYSGSPPTPGSGGTTFLCSLPTNARTTGPLAIGSGRIFLAASAVNIFHAELNSATHFIILLQGGGGPALHSALGSGLWDLHLQFTYEAA